MADEALNHFTEEAMKTVKEFSGVFSTFIVVTCCSSYFWTRYKKKTKEIIVFTRYPVAGKAKTRLIPCLGEYGAASLQVSMTEHILSAMQRFHLKDGGTDFTFQYNGGSQKDMKYWLDRKLNGLPCKYRLQSGEGLGGKLEHAIRDSFNRGHDNVIVIGADIPGITESVLGDAFTALRGQGTSGPGMVLGPAKDGGYYLIGFNKQSMPHLDTIFKDIDWGTERVFQQQQDRASQLGVPCAVLNEVLQDVDTEEDVAAFEREVGMSRESLVSEKWSIVIPTLNEAKNIVATLNDVTKSCSSVDNLMEIIICDGGSSDTTVQLVQEYMATSSVPVKLVHSIPGRGHQLAAGGKAATADLLLFLHADSKLPQNFDQAAHRCLQTPGNVAGAFEFSLDVLADKELRDSEPWWFILQMRMLHWGTQVRFQRFEKPYGDQAFFMRKETYNEVGGFPPYKLMEDYIMVERLKTIGHIGVAKGYPVHTSYRRWRKWGFIRVTGLSQLIIMGYHLGVHPDTLAFWYYGRR